MTLLPAMNFQKAPRAFYITPHGNATSRKGYIIDVTEILPASLDQVTGDELIEAAEKVLPPEAIKGTKEEIDLFRGLDGYVLFVTFFWFPKTSWTPEIRCMRAMC